MDTIKPETYAAIRHVNPLLLNKTLENIKSVVDARNTRGTDLQIGATFIVNSHNQDQIQDFASVLIGQIGIDKIIYKYDIYGQYVPHGDISVVIDSLKQAKQLWGMKIDVRNILDEFIPGPPCIVPYFKSVVNPYGDVYSCCLGAQPGEVNGYFLGNISESLTQHGKNGFAMVWKNSKLVRDEMLKGVKCVDCNFTDREINRAYLSFHKNP
jgi:hypothetical protein